MKSIFDAIIASASIISSLLSICWAALYFHFIAFFYCGILDFAHVSSSGESSTTTKFKLLNPAVIDLDDYEKKLRNQIRVYRKFLAERIWAVLPESEQKLLELKLPFEYDDTNKENLLTSLDYANWPITRKDIELVEKEIELAEKFLQQSSDLRNYYREKKESFNLRSNSQQDTTRSELLNNTNRTAFTSRTAVKAAIGEDNTQQAFTNRTVESTSRTNEEQQEDEQDQQEEKSEADKLEAKMKSTKDKEDKLSRGDRVIARDDLLGYFYAGKVSKVVDSRHANVKFDNGPKQMNMSFRNIIKTSGMTPYLCLGDYVMASVINEHDQRCWVPGIVQTIDHGSYPKLFSILYFNGQEGENIRQELVKINKSAYGFITNYIRSRLGIKTNVRIHHEPPKSGVPPPRPPTPDMDELKKDIIDQIKLHFDSLRLDDKYQTMYEELYNLRKKQKNAKYDLTDRLKVLRNDFEEFRKSQPLRIQNEPPSVSDDDDDYDEDKNNNSDDDSSKKKKKKSNSIAVAAKKERITLTQRNNNNDNSSKKKKNKTLYDDSDEDDDNDSRRRKRSDSEDEQKKKPNNKNKNSSKKKYDEPDEEEEEEEEEEQEVTTRYDNDEDDNEDENQYSARSRNSRNKSANNNSSINNTNSTSKLRNNNNSNKKNNAAAKKNSRGDDEQRVNKKDYEPVAGHAKYPDNLSVEEKRLKLRRELPPLQPGEEVLARWPDDGWYYRSVIKQHLGNFKYKVEDGLRDEEEMQREDIISEFHDSHDSFEAGDPVVALHPHYSFSYAPGQVVQVSTDLTKLVIKFYDHVQSVVFREDVYKLDRLKFELDIDAIIKLEKQWVGQTVVARNNFSNVYELGKVISRVGFGRQYTIEWSNGKQSIQNANHIFGYYTRNPKMIVNDYVLAPKETIFLPGRIIGKRGEQLRVKFVDGIIDESVNYDDCYWLSRDYYEDACSFYRREVQSNDNNNNDTITRFNNGGAAEAAATTNDEDYLANRETPVLDAKQFNSSTIDRVRSSMYH